MNFKRCEITEDEEKIIIPKIVIEKALEKHRLLCDMQPRMSFKRHYYKGQADLIDEILAQFYDE